MDPDFRKDLSVQVENHLTGANCVLKRMDEVEPTKVRLSQITSICNESKVYSWLFRDILGDKPYTDDKAEEFFKWGRSGWSENGRFIFLLLTSKGEVAAAIDVKSSDLEHAEIGFWASRMHRGCMTNTTKELLKLAQQAGFRKLFARIRKGNKDSEGVLLRAGLEFDPLESEENEFYNEVLGFEEEFIFGNPPFYAGVKLGNVIIHLNSVKENDTRKGSGSLYVYCDEVDSYCKTVLGKGAEITSKLDTWPYGMRDFQLKDLDGNLLCFGCPVKAESDEG